VRPHKTPQDLARSKFEADQKSLTTTKQKPAELPWHRAGSAGHDQAARAVLRRVHWSKEASRPRTHKSRLFGNRWLPQTTAALLTSACRLAFAYNRVGRGRTPSAVPSSSNSPASHLSSELGLIAQFYPAFPSPPLGRPTRIAAPGDSSAAVATRREGHRSPRSGQEDQHRRWGRGPL
jgi:hypothetical protein